jgi:hypothetical protein
LKSNTIERADDAAICVAGLRQSIRSVAIKEIEQQYMQKID